MFTSLISCLKRAKRFPDIIQVTSKVHAVHILNREMFVRSMKVDRITKRLPAVDENKNIQGGWPALHSMALHLLVFSACLKYQKSDTKYTVSRDVHSTSRQLEPI